MSLGKDSIQKRVAKPAAPAAKKAPAKKAPAKKTPAKKTPAAAPSANLRPETAAAVEATASVITGTAIVVSSAESPKNKKNLFNFFCFFVSRETFFFFFRII